MRRLLPVLLLLVPLLAACGGGDGDRLTVYSGRNRELIGPLLDRFSDENDVGVDVRYGDSAELALLIEEEGDRSPADVFISQSPGPLAYLSLDERLEELPDGVADAVDEAYRGDGDRWVGLSGRVRTLVYNTDEVDEDDLPDSVFDLVEPEYEGLVGVAPTNGSFQDFVTAMRADVGDDEALAWLEGLEANGAEPYADNGAVVQAVARGEVAMGLVNHYYNLRQLDEDPGSPTANHFYDDGDLGALLLVAGAGVVADADRADEGRRLIEFLLEEEAQEYFAEETFEYPLLDGVDPNGETPPLDDLSLPDLPLDELGLELSETVDLIERSGL